MSLIENVKSEIQLDQSKRSVAANKGESRESKGEEEVKLALNILLLLFCTACGRVDALYILDNGVMCEVGLIRNCGVLLRECSDGKNRDCVQNAVWEKK